MHPLRNADNRISHNWHNILVNQKSAYLFAYAPILDTGEEHLNNEVNEVLGCSFAKVCKNLAIEASNCGTAWLHYCGDTDGNFRIFAVNTEEVLPIYSNDLYHNLQAIIREYQITMDEKLRTVWEFWDDNDVTAFYDGDGTILPYACFDGSNSFSHGLGAVPFIEFCNNNLKTSDLDNVKQLIDVYDKVYSGFVNDIEDIQQVIFILTNYGGQNLEEFLRDLKRYKTVDMQQSSGEDHSGISTLSIDIPVQARNDLLTMTRRQIFISGQGVDPEHQQLQAASGVALRYLYSLLEMKAGLMETEFREGFEKLIHAILQYRGKSKKVCINQTFTRCAIQNDLEQAQIINALKDVTSQEVIAKNNPLVEDWTTENSREFFHDDTDKEKKGIDTYE